MTSDCTNLQFNFIFFIKTVESRPLRVTESASTKDSEQDVLRERKLAKAAAVSPSCE